MGRAFVIAAAVALGATPAASALDIVIDPPSSPVVVERHFTVEARTGSVLFGDGARGAVPPTGTSITTTYQAGEGTTVLRIGAQLSASVVTLKPAFVALPPAAGDDDKGDDQPQ